MVLQTGQIVVSDPSGSRKYETGEEFKNSEPDIYNGILNALK
ncbi:MAG: hypothetical protein U5N86_01000 [Planctomycetota bacterium]|nr:hypothetical protein [Planctomycetota bacterium]